MKLSPQDKLLCGAVAAVVLAFLGFVAFFIFVLLTQGADLGRITMFSGVWFPQGSELVTEWKSPEDLKDNDAWYEAEITIPADQVDRFLTGLGQDETLEPGGNPLDFMTGAGAAVTAVTLEPTAVRYVAGLCAKREEWRYRAVVDANSGRVWLRLDYAGKPAEPDD